MDRLARRAISRSALLATALVVTVLGVAPAQEAAAQSLEYPVKANYLVRFAAFVEWPPTAFASADAPLTICVVGRDPFGRLLDDAVAGQRIAGRQVVARRLSQIGPASGCHVAYLGGLTDAARRAVLSDLVGTSALTVTDRADGGSAGMISFVIDRNRVRFHIDSRSARTGRLSISSRLLSLALSVQGG